MAVTFGTGCFDQGSGWEAEPRFMVVTDSVERAADALLVAAERFMMVGESGTEQSADEDFWDEEDRGPGSTRVSVDDDAAYLAADTDAWLSRSMADTMKSILVQELTRVGVSAVITADYNPIRGIGARRWPQRTD